MNKLPFKLKTSIQAVLLYFIYFLEPAGLVMPLILFPSLLVGKEEYFFSATVTMDTKNLILGFLFAAFPIGQFFGSPILGSLSDKLGRKKILLLSTFGTFLTFALAAYSVFSQSINGLFFSRLMGGLFGANMTLATATISDLAPKGLRDRYMAAIPTVGGLARTLASYFTGALVALFSFSRLAYAFPFISLAFLFFISFLGILFLFEKDEVKSNKGFGGLKGFVEVIRYPDISWIFLSLIFVLMGRMFYLVFFAPYLVQELHWTLPEVGKSYCLIYFCWFLGGLFTQQTLFQFFSSIRVLSASVLASAGVLAAFIALPDTSYSWGFIAAANFFQAIALASYYALFAEKLPSFMQGRIFGAANAMYALSGILASSLSGYLASFNLMAPFMAACILIAIAWGVLQFQFHKMESNNVRNYSVGRFSKS